MISPRLFLSFLFILSIMKRRIILFGLAGLAIAAGTGVYYQVVAEKYAMLTATPFVPYIPLINSPIQW